PRRTSVALQSFTPRESLGASVALRSLGSGYSGWTGWTGNTTLCLWNFFRLVPFFRGPSLHSESFLTSNLPLHYLRQPLIIISNEAQEGALLGECSATSAGTPTVSRTF